MTTLAPSAPAPARYTREDILRLGQSAQPWSFLPIALQALRQAPQDHALRFLTAANFAQLALVTPAREHLALLPEPAAADPGVRQLLTALAALPSDEIPREHLIASVESNLGAMPQRDAALHAALDAWRASLSDWMWLRARDGNIVRRVRRATPDDPSAFRHLADHRAAAQRFAHQHLIAPKDQPCTLYIEGADPPWLLLHAHAATPRAKDGFQTRLVLLQSDPAEFLDALAHADLRDVLRSSRLHLLIGPDASGRLRDFLSTRGAYRLVDPFIPLLSTRTRLVPPVDAVLAEADRAQSAEHAQRAARVASRYAPCDAGFWSRRYREALSPGAREPLRVLIPTTRYSTFIQHSSRDLVAAFERAGCRARLLIEPDDSSRFTTLAYLRELDEFRPDLIILINYYRHQVDPSRAEPWLPRSIPFITWVQDNMPQLHAPDAGARLGTLDFLAGHIPDEFRTRLNLPRERTLKTPVVASGAKFHPGPIDPALRARFECEIAFLSHHSETPEQMHRRMLAEAGSTPLTTAILEEVRPLLAPLVHDPMAPDLLARLGAAVRAIVDRRVSEPDRQSEIAEHITRQYALPLVERILRHQTLDWAADLARGRGWRLHIYGRGWDQHPTLATFARGEVVHGEELRACYQSATIHLHASATALVHQRLSECALSGGLPIARLIQGALDLARGAAIRDAICDDAPCTLSQNHTARTYATPDHPSLLAYAALLQRLGLPVPDAHTATHLPPERLAVIHKVPLEQRPDWVYADLAQTTFRTPLELGAIVQRALDRPAWRDATSRAIAARAAGLTHDALVPRLIDLVRRNLPAEP